MSEYIKKSTPEEAFGPIPPIKEPLSEHPTSVTPTTGSNSAKKPVSSPQVRRKSRRVFITSALGAGGLTAIGAAYYLFGLKTPSLSDFSPPAAKKESPTPLPQYEIYSGERLAEQQKWEESLGNKIHVDPLPPYLKPDVIEKLKSYGLHLRYIPQLRYNMGLQIGGASPINRNHSGVPTPEWQGINQSNKPGQKQVSFQHLEPKFWQELNSGKIPSPSLPGQWAAVEVMPKPDINQPYPDSFFTFDKGYQRRVHISWSEVYDFLAWTKKNTLKNIGLANVPAIELRMLEAVEWNLLANREQWPANASAEWTNTSYGSTDKVIIGAGGHSRYQTNSRDTSYPFWGYRVGMFFGKNSTESPTPVSYPTTAPPFKIIQGITKPKVGEVTSIKYGEHLFDEDDVEKTFGFKIPPDQIPRIPFSSQELQAAEKRGEYLILRADQNERGEPLTMARMNYLMQPDIIKEFGGSKFSVRSDGFAQNQTPRKGWSLVSSVGIAGSEKQNYFEQTKSLAAMVPQLYAHSGIPAAVMEALEEWERSKDEIGKLIYYENNDKSLAAERVTGLKLNQLLRRSPAEYIYDVLLHASRKALVRFKDNVAWSAQAIPGNQIISPGYDRYHNISLGSARPAAEGRNSLIISKY